MFQFILINEIFYHKIKWNSINKNLIIFYINFFYEETPLCHAVYRKLTDIVKLLLSKDNIQINMPYTYSLYSLSEKEYYDEGYSTVKPKKEEFHYSKKTALHFASINGDVEILKLLLTNPSLDVNILSKSKVYNTDNCDKWNHAEFSDEDWIKILMLKLHLMRIISITFFN